MAKGPSRIRGLQLAFVSPNAAYPPRRQASSIRSAGFKSVAHDLTGSHLIPTLMLWTCTSRRKWRSS